MDSLILYTFLKAYRNMGRIRFRLAYLYRLIPLFKKSFYQDSFTWLKKKVNISKEKVSSYPNFNLGNMFLSRHFMR
jgi:hypothetical protein